MWKDKLLDICSVLSKPIAEWLKPRTIFSAMFYGTTCYLILKQMPIPEILKQIVSFMMGFYFGKKMPDQMKKEE